MSLGWCFHLFPQQVPSLLYATAPFPNVPVVAERMADASFDEVYASDRASAQALADENATRERTRERTLGLGAGAGVGATASTADARDDARVPTLCSSTFSSSSSDEEAATSQAGAVSFGTLSLTLLGGTCGKTCFLQRWVSGTFMKDGRVPAATIGMGREVRDQVALASGASGSVIVWDTAGEERCPYVIGNFFRAKDGFVICFDITCEGSWHRAQFWYQKVCDECTEPRRICLVGLKADLEDRRRVSRDEVRSFAESNNVQYFEASAKTNVGVDEAFSYAIEEALAAKT